MHFCSRSQAVLAPTSRKLELAKKGEDAPPLGNCDRVPFVAFAGNCFGQLLKNRQDKVQNGISITAVSLCTLDF